MDKETVRQYALLQALMTERDAINARLKGMEIMNQYRLSRNESPAYPETSFFKIEDELNLIAKKIMTTV